jgi:hypothetical protein
MGKAGILAGGAVWLEGVLMMLQRCWRQTRFSGGKRNYESFAKAMRRLHKME